MKGKYLLGLLFILLGLFLFLVTRKFLNYVALNIISLLSTVDFKKNIPKHKIYSEPKIYPEQQNLP